MPAFLTKDGNLFLCTARGEESLDRKFLISKDAGKTWAEDLEGFTFKKEFCGPAVLNLKSGKSIAFHFEVKKAKDDSFYIERFEYSPETKKITGPLQGKFEIPSQFSKSQPYWFHGNVIQTNDGRIIAPIQTGDFQGNDKKFNVLIYESLDEGRSWKFLYSLGGKKEISHISLNGFQSYGPVEVNLQETKNNNFILIARLSNDDIAPPLPKPTATYSDLSKQVDGKYIIGGKENLFYEPGPNQPPLAIISSSDAGKNWTKFTALPEARGMFPRMAQNKDKSILVLTYGALKSPRWGNAFQYSTNGGKTWSKQVIFSKEFTTGYTDIVWVKDNTFHIFFDSANPQPAYLHQGHLVKLITLTFKK